MRPQAEVRPIGEIIRAMIHPRNEQQRELLVHPRHDLGDEIAALDEHWIFRRSPKQSG